MLCIMINTFVFQFIYCTNTDKHHLINTVSGKVKSMVFDPMIEKDGMNQFIHIPYTTNIPSTVFKSIFGFLRKIMNLNIIFRN